MNTDYLTSQTDVHIFIPLENELAVKKVLHKALTTAGYASLPTDPETAHIADYLERVFGDIDSRADGWMIESIQADDYQVLTEHVAPALCGLVTINPEGGSLLEYPTMVFVFETPRLTQHEIWVIAEDEVRIGTI